MKQLRPYQNDIIQRTLDSKSKTILIQLPTGTGKTVIASKLIKNFATSLFVTPRINLVNQTIESFEDEIDVGVLQGSNTRDLNKDHIVASLSTLKLWIKQERFVNKYEVIIFDEVHYSYDSIMKLTKELNNCKIIGLTATPYDKEGRVIKGFKEVLNSYDIRYFIEKKYLSDLELKQISKVDTSKLKVVNNEFTQRSIDHYYEQRHESVTAVNNSLEYIKDRKKIIVFTSNILHCELVAALYQEHGFKTLTLHSNCAENQNKILHKFRTDKSIKILISVSMVTFGTDLPFVDAGVVIRPTQSITLWKQITGRILRSFKGKKNALLLDCSGNIDRLGNPLDNYIPVEKKKKIYKKKTTGFLSIINNDYEEPNKNIDSEKFDEALKTLMLEYLNYGRLNGSFLEASEVVNKLMTFKDESYIDSDDIIQKLQWVDFANYSHAIDRITQSA